MNEHTDWDRLLRLLRGETPAAVGVGEENWEPTARLAQQLAVAPQLYRRLSEPGVNAPAGLLARLRSAYVHAGMRNTRLYHFLDEVLAALEGAEAPVLLLKGAFLAKGIYGNIALRPMGDVDLLVPYERVVPAARALEAIGYIPLKPVTLDHLRRNNHLPTFSRPDASPLELHGTSMFFPLPRLMSAADFALLWQRAGRYTLDGHEVHVLSPEDQVVYLCCHVAFGHRFTTDLHPFFDIAEVIRHYGAALDWDIIAQRARQWGVWTAVALTLYLARAWVGAAVPTGALPADVAGTDAATLDYIREKIFDAPEERLTIDFNRRVPASGERTRLHAITLKAFYGSRGFTIMSRPLVNSLFPPAAEMARLYPHMRPGRWRLLWHHLARHAGIARLYGRLLVGLLRGQVVVRLKMRDEVRLRRLLRRDNRPYSC